MHGYTREQATSAANLLSEPASAEGERLFVLWWQSTFDDLAPDAQVQPWVNDLHHELFDRLRPHLGAEVRMNVLPQVVWLPCRTCGRKFESRPPRYARNCNDCAHANPRPQHAATHANGLSRPYWTDGAYARGPHRPQAWWYVLCQHPDCLTVFSTTSRLACYCEQHTSRVSAQRARQRNQSPKPTHFRFRLAEDLKGEPLQELTFTGSDGRQISLVPGMTYVPRDEIELSTLAAQLESGTVELA